MKEKPEFIMVVGLPRFRKELFFRRKYGALSYSQFR